MDANVVHSSIYVNTIMRRLITRQVGVVMSEETYNQLIQITDEKEVPISVFVRELIEDHFAKELSALRTSA
jgi:predicted DNA-binding protein